MKCIAPVVFSVAISAVGCTDQPDPTLTEDEAEFSGPQRIVVMSQNQYLGADLTGIIAAPDAGAFNQAALEALAQIGANRFDDRAWSLAFQILVTSPDVVGIQEAFSFTRNGVNGEAPFRDHLADTLEALHHLGLRYTVAAQVQNLAVTIPIDSDGDGVPDTAVGVLDRDVILVRDDHAATAVPYSAGCARPSLDGGPGCNYQVVATANTAVGPLSIERGFIGVDVSIRGRDYRVVNTHLEVPDLDPTNPLSAAIQAAQAQELTATLAGSTPAERTLITLGDFNSSPEDQIIVVGGLTIVPPYLQLVAAGQIDTWLLDARERRGDTCCQAEDLRNEKSALSERIDLVFSSVAPDLVRSNVLGDQPYERFPIGLWPSDHGTVVGRLRF